jgi:hypothetical protein
MNFSSAHVCNWYVYGTIILDPHMQISLTILHIPRCMQNKALTQAKRESWRRHCEKIEKAPECARINSIPSKTGQSAISSIQLGNEEYITTENETLKELLQVHFPGSEIILEHSGGWDGLEMQRILGRLGFPKVS